MHNKLFNTNIDNANIENDRILLTPNEIKSKLPLTQLAEQRVLAYRQEIEDILDFQDRRKFIVVTHAQSTIQKQRSNILKG